MASLDKYKLTQNTWDSDKDPNKFWEFMYLMAATVRAIAYGEWLENYLDVKLDRGTSHQVTTPSFITDDPDFAPVDRQPASAVTAPEDDAASVNNAPSRSMGRSQASAGTMGSQQLTSAGSYFDLPEEARNLDALLYSVLKVCIRGSKRVLLDCVSFPSYVQAMCILARHCDISKTDRITRAFEAVDQIAFHGDVTVWQAEVVRSVRELFDSGASIMHYVLSRIMKSFAGKLKTIQYRIAEDINSRVIDDQTNIFDMVQKYAVEIASVGDSKPGAVNAAMESTDGKTLCPYCHRGPHTEEQCFKKQRDLGGGKGSGKGGNKRGLTCHYCHELGHVARDCPKKQNRPALVVQGADAEAPAPAPAPAPANNTATAPAQHVQTGLSQLLGRMQAAQLQLINSSPINCTASEPDRYVSRVSHPARSLNLSSLEEYLELHRDTTVAPGVSGDPDFDPPEEPGGHTVAYRHRSPRGRNGERIGEAKRPGPAPYNGCASRLFPSLTCSKLMSLIAMSVAVVSVCDGMGCAALALQNCGAEFDKYVAFEIDVQSREVCQFANPPSRTFPGVNHSVRNNIYEVTEADIAAIGQIVLFIAATPCGDFSKLRLLPPRNFQGTNEEWSASADPRPGLDGPNGSKFRQMLLIMSWVFKHNTECEYFIENLVFDDLPEDWEEVCSVLGVPLEVNAQDYSRTKRNRAYWHNFRKLVGLPPPTLPPLDPNDCMGPGRVIQTYWAEGRECVRPIGKSWGGDPDNPVADTRLPVMVKDELYQNLQHLRPEEAEGLMGMPINCTAAPGVSARKRLEIIGNGWDVIVTTILLAHCQLSKINVVTADAPLEVDDAELTACLVASLKTDGPDYVAGCLLAMPDDWAVRALQLLERHYVYQLNGDYSVIDSGSAKHLSGSACVLDADNRSALTGFDGSMQWTEGNGYLPVAVVDEDTGEAVMLDFDDVDLMTQDLVTNILSLGKMLRAGYDFHLTEAGKSCYAVSPGGAHRIRLQLGLDDILRMKHAVRSGPAAVRIPRPSGVMILRRSAGNGSYSFLHDVFNHCGSEKLYRTLGVTRGYKQVRLKPELCNTCAVAKARNFGLRKSGRCSDAPAVSSVMLVDGDQDPVFDDDTSDDDGSDAEGKEGVQYTAAVAGRELGSQSVPRFDLHKLRVFEVMFVDNKDYPCQIRGGAKQALLFICCKTRMKAVVDVSSKKHNGQAFSNIVALNGIHKMPYLCRVYSDGCGSMVHVKDAAVRAGIDHAYIPPHQQSLNEAEKIADRMWESARAHVQHARAPDNVFGLAVQFALYVDIRSATTDTRSFKTPFELSRGLVPDVSRIHRFWTKCHVTVPKSKRKALAKKGLHHLRAEPGRFVGFQSLFSSTYAVLLDGEPRRLVHGINVTFDDTDFTSSPGPDIQHGVTEFNFQPGGVQSEEAKYDKYDGRSEEAPARAEAEEANPLCNWPQAQVHIEPIQEPIHKEYLPHTDDWFYNEASPQPRPRPHYTAHVSNQSQSVVRNLIMMATEETEVLDQCIEELQSHGDFNTYYTVCHLMALHTTKDMDWKTALAGPDADKAVAALQLEMASLLSTILTPIDENHPEYEEARRLATPGRILLDIKRCGLFKARGVKQGCRENKEIADGPDFNYYAHVAQLTSVRASLFRYKRGTRRVAIKDVRTAFLQSDPYPEGTVKYICFKNPLTQKWEYFRQSGPIYGEASAPVRWEQTIGPFLESDKVGLIRGDNERCCFLHPTRDLLALLYVDDCLEDGEEDDVNWLSNQLDERFDCKDLEYLNVGDPLDYLGITITLDDKYLYTSMGDYIRKCVKILEWEHLKPVGTPMNGPITYDSPLLGPEMARKALTAIGMAGWLSMTVRCDITYTHSRIAQHQSRLTEAVLQSIKRLFQYLSGTADLGIRAPLYDDYDNCAASAEVDPRYNNGWEFFVDSDFMSNTEEQNSSRSQNGYIALLNGAPVMWSSKVSSVAFADHRIKEAHADISSGAAEVYAAGNASMDFLYLNHVMEEMNVLFPEPYFLQIDNTAAITFAKGTAMKTKLKHIDARQDWVKVLRNKNISVPVHVPTELNLADMFTKILAAPTFTLLRNRILHMVPVQSM